MAECKQSYDEKLAKTLLSSALVFVACERARPAPGEAVVRSSSGAFVGTSIGVTAAPCRGFETSPLSLSSRLVRVERPVDTGSPSGQVFAYTVEYVPPTIAGSPVVVRLPGAAGSSLLGTTPSLPEGWGYLNTEPRGVGCNAPSQKFDPRSAFTSEVFAADVEAVMAKTGARSFLLHGVGFGTVVATKLAARLDAKGVRVVGVVLEGALARAYPDSTPPFAEAIRKWEAVRASLTAGERLALAQHTSQEAAWGPVFVTRLGLGAFPLDSSGAIVNPLREAIEVALSDSERNAKNARNPASPAQGASLRALLGSDGTPWPEERKSVFRYMACRELSLASSAAPLAGLVYEAGVLAADPADTTCAGLTLSDPLDSASFPSRYPIHSFLGDADIASPLWQGLRHAADARATTRFVTVVHGAGRLPLSAGLADCALRVWEAIGSGGGNGNAAAVLPGCRLKTSFAMNRD